MPTHPRRRPARLALAGAIAGTLATGALAGPAMAASDDGSASPNCRKAGGDQQESLLHMRKAGGIPDFVTARKAGGEGIGWIIAI